MSTTGMRPRKDQKNFPLFDPTAEKIMMSNWEVWSLQSTTFPSIMVSKSLMLILWFPTIFLPLVSFFLSLVFFFWNWDPAQILRPIRALMKDDWHSLVNRPCRCFLHTQSVYKIIHTSVSPPRAKKQIYPFKNFRHIAASAFLFVRDQGIWIALWF